MDNDAMMDDGEPASADATVPAPVDVTAPPSSAAAALASEVIDTMTDAPSSAKASARKSSSSTRRKTTSTSSRSRKRTTADTAVKEGRKTDPTQSATASKRAQTASRKAELDVNASLMAKPALFYVCFLPSAGMVRGAALVAARSMDQAKLTALAQCQVRDESMEHMVHVQQVNLAIPAWYNVSVPRELTGDGYIKDDPSMQAMLAGKGNVFIFQQQGDEPGAFGGFGVTLFCVAASRDMAIDLLCTSVERIPATLRNGEGVQGPVVLPTEIDDGPRVMAWLVDPNIA